MFGWKGDSLQKAMNARCNGDKCKELLSQSAEDSEKCTIPQTMKEDVDGSSCTSFPSLTCETGIANGGLDRAFGSSWFCHC